MVKTTIILDDEIYKKLINESIEKYGTAKKLSVLINEKLRAYNKPENPDHNKLTLTYRLGRQLSNAEINHLKEEYRGKTEWKQ